MIWGNIYQKAVEDAAQSEQGGDPAAVNAIYPPIPPEPIPETEEERKERMWRAVTDFARST